MKTFEKYLMEDVWEAEGVLDDDMSDAFDTWLTELQIDDVIAYAKEWGESIIKRRVTDVEVIIARKLPYDGECTEDLIDLLK